MTAEALSQGDYQAERLLEYARASVDPVLRGVVGVLPPKMRRICGYHLGWWDRSGIREGGDSGKAVRPALVLAAARAAGGADGMSRALAGAAAVELVHNFTLLHDDVMDRDDVRRHRATAWSVFGIPDAILAGDAMQAAAVSVLAGDPHPAAALATARLIDCVIELCEGQSADIAFEARTDVSLEECLAMAAAKTGALLGCACAIGGLYAGADAADVAALDAFGRELGLGFQLIDDLLGIWGCPEAMGKPAGGDLAAGKKSLPVVFALTSGTTAGAELRAIYGRRPALSEWDVPRMAGLVEAAGGRAWAQEAAAERISSALEQLARVFPEPERAGELLALAELVTRRDR
ncbi:family 2 encapsulin nanocompartment cargo protein polyprenyl transferase [Streptomyces sp. NPDC051555]|uniref:family 2 encapsulin nanocompartment cargo protein polyprenyl transferase n=1 Tax=Streptomyces sp. NPDC051555 TaxID=3365657 RepID=UPI0037A08E5F